eukprot:sb/3468726/
MSSSTREERKEGSEKEGSEMASQFSERHLFLAVHDDTEKKAELPMTHASLGEILIREHDRKSRERDEAFHSQSRAVIRKTVRQIADEAKAIEDAKKMAFLARFQKGGRNKISMTLIKNFLARKKHREKLQKAEEPQVVKTSNVLVPKPKVGTLPKIDRTQFNPDPEPGLSYGKFLYNEFSSTIPKLPELPQQTTSVIPSRTPQLRKTNYNIPKHLERFKYMRIKNSMAGRDYNLGASQRLYRCALPKEYT